MCVRVCVCVRACVCMYVCMYVCVHAYVYLYIVHIWSQREGCFKLFLQDRFFLILVGMCKEMVDRR